MEAAIEMAESGRLVIGTLHTKSCAETIDRMINFYDISDQPSIKYLLSALLKLVVSQRLLKGKSGKLVLVPEVMVVDNIISGIIRKEKKSVSEIEMEEYLYYPQMHDAIHVLIYVTFIFL